MKKINSNSGVTLVMLIVLIIVMLILLSLVLNFSTKPIQDSIDTQYKSELYIIQHALYEKLIENNAQKSENKYFPGEPINIEELPNEFVEAYKEVLETDDEPSGNYYKIYSKKDEYENIDDSYFKNLGLDGERVTESEFIVNYETGEVYNNTKKVYSDKTPVYLSGYAKDGKESTSNMIDY